MSIPQVSVIIPTYNRAHLISETLDSVIMQTYTNWECIIVDDRSSDNTFEVVGNYLKKDSRFQYFERPIERQKGASTCRNLGFEISKGSYIQYLDSDDLISENKLQEQMAILKNASSNSIATCKWGRFSNIYNDKIIFDNFESYHSFDSAQTFLTALANSKGYFPIHSYLIKRNLIENSGGWNEYLSLNDDGEFMMRLIVNVEKVCFSSKAYAYYRFGDASNLSSFNQEQKIADMINSFRMIEYLFKIRFKVKSVYYIEKMKEGLFDNIIKSYPNLIIENKDFFINQLNDRSLVERVKKRLRIYFKYGK
ncbi:glycosyltransferase family 2 protein [Flavobacterium sp. XS2P39]|uniref:glycosyltransferase family 2 protein n=1 Tax=Flavobacterium sp. XS2P39 TaxID=3401725 RepID=UPI003AAAC989